MAKGSRGFDAGTTERTIYFYRINNGLEESGQPTPFPARAVLDRLQAMPYTARLVNHDRDDGPVMFAWVDPPGANGQMRLAHIRRDNLPQIERAGKLSNLDIPEDAGLVEVVHIRFFPKNIVGAVFNFFGPRPGRLARYLQATVPEVCPPTTTLDTLVNPDIVARLDRMQDLRLLQLHVRASYMDRLRQAQTTLGNALRGTLNVADAESVEIVLRSSPRSGGLGKELLRFVRKLAGRRDLKAGVQKLKVRGKLDSGRVELVDVLSDDLLVKRRLPLARTRGRALNDQAAYDAIAAAHQELRKEIQLASAVAIASGPDDETKE